MILFVALLGYQPALHNDFCHDDVRQVGMYAPPNSLTGVVVSLGEPWWPASHRKSLWRPLTRATIAAQRLLHAETRWPFYFVNILLHAGASLLAFGVARRLLSDMRAAGLAAMIFAAHPLHGEAVHQIVGRAEIIATVGMLAGLLSLLRWGVAARRQFWIQPLCMAIALGGKEQAILYPLFAGLLLIAPQSPNSGMRPPSRSTLMLFLILVITGLAYLGLKFFITGGMMVTADTVPWHENPLFVWTFAQRLPAGLGIFGYAVLKFFWPAGLSPDYAARSLPFESGWHWPAAWLGLLILAVLVGMTIQSFRRRGACWAGIVAGLAAYGLTSNLPFPIGTALAERLWYWPSAFACLAIGGVAGRLLRLHPRFWKMQRFAILTASLTLALLAAGWQYAPAWRNSAALAEATLARFPDSYRAHVNLAREDYLARRVESGYRHARRALEIHADEATGWFWLGMNAAMLAGHGEEAERAYARALELDPELHETWRNWGLLLESLGRNGEAIEKYQRYLAYPNLTDRGKIEARARQLTLDLRDAKPK